LLISTQFKGLNHQGYYLRHAEIFRVAVDSYFMKCQLGIGVSYI